MASPSRETATLFSCRYTPGWYTCEKEPSGLASHSSIVSSSSLSLAAARYAQRLSLRRWRLLLHADDEANDPAIRGTVALPGRSAAFPSRLGSMSQGGGAVREEKREKESTPRSEP